MTPRRSGSLAANLARGLASLLALLALLAGLPALLWFLTSVLLPHGVSLDELTALMTSRNLGAPFFAVVMAGGWAGWAVFAVCTLLEIPAQLRGRPSLSMPVPSLGVQRLAATLVGGVLLLLPAQAAMAAPSHTAPAHTPSVSAAAPHSAPASAPQAAAPASATSYTVQPRDSLTKIALAELGDATRWTEIAHANDGRTMTDGTRFSARGVLQPGWKLLMPKDWKAGQPQDAQRAQDTGHREHTVQAGETLSQIAQDELGDSADYVDIARLNQGKTQPDGRTFTDADDIHPGWQLALPHTGAPAPDTSADTPEDAAPDSPAEKDDSAKEPSRTAPPEQPAAPDRDAAGSDTHRDAMPSTPAPEQAPPEQTSPAPADDRTPDAEPAGEEAGPSIAITAAAVTSLFAATVLAVIGARRAHQQRRRRHKRRIPMPEAHTPGADLEQEMRTHSSADGLDLLHQALRTLAANCARSARPLPEIEAARLDPRGLELHLSAPAPAIAPFTESDSDPAVWWCPARGTSLLSTDEGRDITAPYPALVSIGETTAGDPVLVNLETIGLLQLQGSTDDVTSVMLGMAVELASSALTDDTALLLSGLGAELETVFPARIQHHAQLAAALDDLRAHDALQRGALDAAGADSLLSARLSADGGDTWIPRVLMNPAAPGGSHAETLSDLLSSRPRTALAVITSAEEALELPGAWLVPAAPGAEVRLPGLDLTVTLQRLEPHAYGPLLDLLGTSNRSDDIPAPAWTRPDATAAPQTAAGPQAPGRPAREVPVHVSAATTGDFATALPDFTALAPAAAAPAGHGQAETDDEGLSAEAVGDSALAQDAAAPPQAEPADDAFEPEWASPAPDGPIEEDTSEDPWEAEDSALSPAVSSESAASSPSTAEPLLPDLPDSDTPVDFDDVFAEVLNEQGAGSDADVPDHADDPHDGTDHPEAQPADEPAPQAPSPELSAALAPKPPLARVTAVTSHILAALNTPPDPPAGPQIRILGAVDVVGALGRVETYRRNSLTEIAAWLVLHPGRNRHELDEAIWPGQRVNAKTRNTSISKLRTWLGRDPRLPADAPDSTYLLPVTDGVYTFNDDVTADWHQFQDLYGTGMNHHGEDADAALAHALALVRGRPFSGIDQSRYVWAEHHIQEMISAGVDVAHELAMRRIAARDFRAAASAASIGLTCDIQAELLYRDLFQIYSETGDRAGLERTAHQLNRISTETGLDSSPETVALLNALLAANAVAGAAIA